MRTRQIPTEPTAIETSVCRARNRIQSLVHGLVRSIVFLAFLGVVIGTTETFAAKPYKVGDKVEVLFLGDWIPAKVVRVDHRGIVTAEYEFARSTKQRAFQRTAIRRANEAGALSPSRFWSSQSGKFRIRAVLLSVDDKTVTLRKEDMTELQVPIEKLSDGDRRFLKRFTKEETRSGTKGASRIQLPPIEHFAGGMAKSATSDKHAKGFGKGVGNFGATVEGSPKLPAGTNVVTGRVALTPDPVPRYLKLQQGGAAIAVEGFFQRVGAVMPIGGPDAWLLASIEDDSPSREERLPTQLVWVSLDRKKVEQEQQLTPNELVMDYHPSSHRLLTLTQPDRHGDSEQKTVLTLWEVVPTTKQPKPVARWYANSAGGRHQHAPWARLVDSNTVIQRSDKQEFTVWDVKAKKLLYQINQESFIAPDPTLSGGRKYLFLPENKQVRALECRTGRTVLVLPFEGDVAAVAISDDGSRAAALGRNMLTVWDLTDASAEPQQYQAEAIGNPFNTKLSWVGTDRLMADSGRHRQILFSLKHRTIVWNYQFDSNASPKSFGGRSRCIINDHLAYSASISSGSNRGLAVGAVELPGPKVDEMTVSIDRESLLLLKPGVSVRLDVLAGEFTNRVQKALESEIKKNGWILDPNASISVRAEMKRGETQQVTYGKSRFGIGFRGSQNTETVTVTPYLSTISILVGEKTAWRSGTSSGGAPSRITIKEGQSIQAEVDKMQNPYPDFYETLDIPDSIIDPAKTLGLGSTLVTNRGLVVKE